MGALLAFACTVCATGCASTIPEGKRECCAPDPAPDLEVLQAVLASVTETVGHRYLVVANEPRAWGLEREWVEGQLAAIAKRDAMPNVALMIADYQSRNAKGHLPTGLGASNVRFVGEQDLATMFAGDVLGGWKRFWIQYPDADALLRLSLPGYSPGRTWAVVSYFVSRGSMAGDAKMVLLHRGASSWVVAWSEILFET